MDKATENMFRQAKEASRKTVLLGDEERGGILGMCAIESIPLHMSGEYVLQMPVFGACPRE